MIEAYREAVETFVWPTEKPAFSVEDTNKLDQAVPGIVDFLTGTKTKDSDSMLYTARFSQQFGLSIEDTLLNQAQQRDDRMGTHSIEAIKALKDDRRVYLLFKVDEAVSVDSLTLEQKRKGILLFGAEKINAAVESIFSGQTSSQETVFQTDLMQQASQARRQILVGMIEMLEQNIAIFQGVMNAQPEAKEMFGPQVAQLEKNLKALQQELTQLNGNNVPVVVG